MNSKQLLDEILSILFLAKDDKEKLEKIYQFLMDEKFQQRLIDALNRNRPFANFKWLIDNSDYRQDWFDYRQAWLEQYVYELLENELNKI